jgi:hypothetical protein
MTAQDGVTQHVRHGWVVHLRIAAVEVFMSLMIWVAVPDSVVSTREPVITAAIMIGPLSAACVMLVGMRWSRFAGKVSQILK